MSEPTIRKPMQGGDRELLDTTELTAWPTTGQIVFEPQRSRPRYFDGRFLAARDLTREQTYFLERQALLGRALSSGVVAGLEVRQGTETDAATLGRTGSTADLLVISAGQGLTPGGELVGFDDDQVIALAEVTESEQLNAAFGLKRRPQPPPRSRTGLFVLGLRPVEFTGNPVASYPTSVTGKRSLEDGDIVESTAVTLVPWGEDASAQSDERRARVAHEIFVQGIEPGLPTGVLPLAMVALDRGTVLWADEWLVRREVGRDDLLGLTADPRALREAHLLHYRDHLDDVLTGRAGQSVRFAASEHFHVLPPAGPLPAAAIGTAADALTQLYFPPEVDAELTIVPDDEVPALLEESLALPPIGLTGRSDDLEGTAVLVLLPVARKLFETLNARLEAESSETDTASDAKSIRLVSAVPGFFSRRRPIDRLRGLELRRLSVVTPTQTNTVISLWQELLAAAPKIGETPMLVYARRRHLRRWEAAGGATPSTGGGAAVTAADEAQILDRVDRITAAADSTVRDEVLTFVSREDMAENRLLLDGALLELEAVQRTEGAVTAADVEAASARYRDPEVTGGLRRAEDLQPELFTSPVVVSNLIETGTHLDFARLVDRAESDEQVVELVKEVEAAGGQTGDAARESLRTLITNRMEETGP